METLGLRRGYIELHRNSTPIMENQMDNCMDSSMEAGSRKWFIRAIGIFEGGFFVRGFGECI